MLITWIGAHILVSAAAAAGFAWQFGQSPRVVASHVLLVGEWDLALLAILSAVVALTRARGHWPRLTSVSARAHLRDAGLLYALNLVSNLSWAAT